MVSSCRSFVHLLALTAFAAAQNVTTLSTNATTVIVPTLTTVCGAAMTLLQNGNQYTCTMGETIIIDDCPCTMTLNSSLTSPTLPPTLSVIPICPVTNTVVPAASAAVTVISTTTITVSAQCPASSLVRCPAGAPVASPGVTPLFNGTAMAPVASSPRPLYTGGAVRLAGIGLGEVGALMGLLALLATGAVGGL